MKHPYVVGGLCRMTELGYVARILKIENEFFTLYIDRLLNKDKGVLLSASISKIHRVAIEPLDDDKN